MGQPTLGVPRIQKGANVMTTLTQQLEPATDGQIKQLARVAADAAEKAVKDFGAFSKEAAQRVHGNPEFAARIREAVVLALSELSVTDQFADEEVESTYGYLSGYKPGGKSIAEQCNTLRRFFPGLGFANHDYIVAIEKGEVMLPQNAEGWFAIPKWEKIAPTYNEAMQKVFDMIKQTRGGKFYNYRDGQLGPERLRQTAKTAGVFQKLGDEQKDHDILVVPAQFGLRHRGRSIRRAREVFTFNEFGLGAFAIGCMLLTHPERLMHYDDLWIDCSGDEYDDPDSHVRFDGAPFFNFGDGRVGFGMGWFGSAGDLCGSAAGFVPPA